MTKEDLKVATAAIFPIIAERLKEAHGIADAAAACAGTGNQDGGFRILLDIEEITTDAITLLNAASLLRREAKK